MFQCWHTAVCLTTLPKRHHLVSQAHRFAHLLCGSVLCGGPSISVPVPSAPRQYHAVMQSCLFASLPCQCLVTARTCLLAYLSRGRTATTVAQAVLRMPVKIQVTDVWWCEQVGLRVCCMSASLPGGVSMSAISHLPSWGTRMHPHMPAVTCPPYPRDGVSWNMHTCLQACRVQYCHSHGYKCASQNLAAHACLLYACRVLSPLCSVTCMLCHSIALWPAGCVCLVFCHIQPCGRYMPVDIHPLSQWRHVLACPLLFTQLPFPQPPCSGTEHVW